MSGTKPTRTSLSQRARGLIAGAQKHPPTGQLTLEGRSFTQATLAQTLQSLIDALSQVDTARAGWKDALKRLADVKADVVPVMRAYVVWIAATYGNAPSILGDYGVAPRKARTPLSTEQQAAAVAKGKATRAARHTMGPKQKKN